MIDVWLIFAQTIPFMEVLLHTLMESWRDESEADAARSGRARRRVADEAIVPVSR